MVGSTDDALAECFGVLVEFLGCVFKSSKIVRILVKLGVIGLYESNQLDAQNIIAFDRLTFGHANFGGDHMRGPPQKFAHSLHGEDRVLSGEYWRRARR